MSDPLPDLDPQPRRSPGGRYSSVEVEISEDRFYGVQAWQPLLGCGRIGVWRLRQRGELPEPDILIGKSPRWRGTTLKAFQRGELKTQAARGQAAICTWAMTKDPRRLTGHRDGEGAVSRSYPDRAGLVTCSSRTRGRPP